MGSKSGLGRIQSAKVPPKAGNFRCFILLFFASVKQPIVLLPAAKCKVLLHLGNSVSFFVDNGLFRVIRFFYRYSGLTI